MNVTAGNSKVQLPNLLLIAGNGRNVGKTFLATKIIKQLSQKEEVVGVKISPHFHPFDEETVLFKNDEFVILEEKKINSKDSSLLLQAGAVKVYFVMVLQQNLQQAFLQLNKFLPQKAIVCESGGLHEFINPGLFLFVKRAGEEIRKEHLLKFLPQIVENDGTNFTLDISNIEFNNNHFSLL
ncbi:MAG: hypothetical protein HQ522_08505 [Bacteroidetes bacterium]|nr:hypothetical protein [Bacteroidota bacterium]